MEDVSKMVIYMIHYCFIFVNSLTFENFYAIIIFGRKHHNIALPVALRSEKAGARH